MYILFAVQHLHFPAGVQFQETTWRQLQCEWAAHSRASERERERERQRSWKKWVRATEELNRKQKIWTFHSFSLLHAAEMIHRKNIRGERIRYESYIVFSVQSLCVSTKPSKFCMSIWNAVCPFMFSEHSRLKWPYQFQKQTNWTDI